MDRDKLEFYLTYFCYLTAGIIIGILLLSSCRKEEIIPSNEATGDVIVKFNEDSVINEVGCYYPIDPQ